MAVELAQDGEKLQRLRGKIRNARSESPLFDTSRFVRNLEKAFEQMWQIRQTGQRPRAIDVTE
jgi:predicted O-linked N-acetylglucosamine transferase (SPINDLY family)